MRSLLDCVQKIFGIFFQIVGVGVLIGLSIGLLFVIMFFI